MHTENTKQYVINGIKISFPLTPYKSQMLMMEKITATLKKPNQNALLESPTGTGKSLAILCSIVGWINAERDRRRNEPNKKQKADTSINFSQEAVVDVSDDGVIDSSDGEEDKKDLCVYVATRTHRQIKQLVDEFKRLDQKVPMAVLGSRKHLCVNKKVNKKESLDEDCNAMRKKRECTYLFNVSKVVDKINTMPAHDIEDIYRVGKDCNGCPYYASKELHDNAEIVFLPYNYILEELLKAGKESIETVVIFDEAHNIEDVCRSVGSLEITSKEFMILNKDLSTTKKALATLFIDDKTSIDGIHSECEYIEKTFGVLTSKLFKTCATRDFTDCSFKGDSMIAFLAEAGLDEESNRERLVHFTADTIPRIEKKIVETKSKIAKISLRSQGIIEKLYKTLARIFTNTSLIDGKDAYSMVLAKREIRDKHETNLSITLACLFPALIFRELEQRTRNIILTSGTLAPMDTFASELGASFCVDLEAPHVVALDQIHTATVPQGPTKMELNGVYRNAITDDYQSEIALSVYEIAKKVPFGVLCFFPSYAAIQKTIRKMKDTGIYSKIGEIKEIIEEPKSGGGRVFDKAIAQYYTAIDKARTFYDTSKTMPKKNGSLMLAVYRGKVSEGLDFIDDNARCVICVGIPYPAYKDPLVSDKIEFNKKMTRKLGLLDGYVWYEAQAYKALNQALGRCIRHSEDWGAVLLLDARLAAKKTENLKISKWAKKEVKKESSFAEAMASLERFIASGMQRPRTAQKKFVPPLPTSSDESDGEENFENKKGMKGQKKLSFKAGRQNYPR
ncbi:MAG: Fanconi anemia group J protein [Amphiamblys sp. WSBS2006]|nr:MAG: Fanconi anemia group J protein [Amphiamblys sp. WSBS2006]